MTDIVERLSYCNVRFGFETHDQMTKRRNKDISEAADTITALRAEVEALRGALGNLLLKAGEVRAIAEEFAPTLPSKTLWMRDVQMFKDAIERARAALKGDDHGSQDNG